MRFRVNNLLNLSRVIENDATAGVCARPLSRFRRTYSDVASTAAVAAQSESAPEPGLGLNTTEPLTDLHGRRHNYLRISLTERCNLRCQYCMPAEGVPLSPKGALLSREELARLVRVFAAAGVDKVRLTGGEPTLRADLADIIQSIKEGGGVRSVSITTNGLVLTRRLVALQRAGLDALNVSLDTLRAPRYEHMTRRAGLSRVLAGIDLALQLGYKPVKINTVLMKGFNDDEICDFVEFTKDKDVEVRFIEFMPFAGNEWDDSKLVPYRRALKAVVERFPDLQPAVPRPHDTARVWQVPGFAGSVGFISSMTQHFCSSCNRLRLTADGNLKVCLFGASEVSLRDALRTGADDAQLDRLVRLALRNKKPQHAARRTVTPSRRVPRGAGVLLAARARLPAAPLAARAYCSASDDESGGALTHFDAQGRARMVDVGEKPVTRRVAEAECALEVSARVLRLLRDARLPKGDALTVAQVAGALAAKRTAELIPLCHPLPLDSVRVHVVLPRGECAAGGAIAVRCEARVTARTGAEMEALTGAAVAALALYDMCKAVDKKMRITGLRVVRKTGGSSDTAREEPPPLRAHDESPLAPGETYAPTNFAYF
ncbi:molybdenum cofactor biosynthesis protein 1 isoform X2 [Manduca sexta]|uniref:Radical SAM core domain-containing protein n=1 Tax=Manduca sexta TaxID=7130 RepID=A0A921YKF5_MANSE|nr:molybdenum cofactor biosynthesis protein 1 isoform X2 [Manduca sexta]KAG6440895.1 hypothetical protein O3G_MSEX001441 [Manduca sexta]